MRHGSLAIFFLLPTLLLTTVFAFSLQESPAAILERDTAVPVQLIHTLDAGKAKVGDRVEVRLQEALTGRDNAVIAHANALVVGHVILVQRHTDQPGKSIIVLAFDSILDGDRETPITAVVISLTAPPRKEIRPAHVGRHPTSGDDAMSRAAGPMVDRSSNTVIVPVTPISEAGFARAPYFTSPDTGPVEVAANAAGQTRLTALDNKDLKIKTDVLLTLRFKSPRPRQ